MEAKTETMNTHNDTAPRTNNFPCMVENLN